MTESVKQHSERKGWEPGHSLHFFDIATNRLCCYVYPDVKHSTAGWLLYKHPDGQWVTWRKATDDDLRRMNKAVVEAHHNEPAE